MRDFFCFIQMCKKEPVSGMFILNIEMDTVSDLFLYFL